MMLLKNLGHCIFIFIFLLLTFTVSAQTGTVSCPAYFLKKENFLIGVNVFNAPSSSSKEIYLLAPDKKITKKKLILQYWFNLNKDTNLQSFFVCLYKNQDNKKNIAKKIPDNIHHCRLSFISDPVIRKDEYTAIERISEAKFLCSTAALPITRIKPEL